MKRTSGRATIRTMEKILVATDGSRVSREAVEFGVELAQTEDAAVMFVHVVPQLDRIPVSGYGLVGSLPHEQCDADRRALDDAEAVAERENVRSNTKLLVGDVVDEIVAYADNLDVDLIVVGSRGHGTLVSTLLGSVSRGVLAESRRPVAVVRGLAST